MERGNLGCRTSEKHWDFLLHSTQQGITIAAADCNASDWPVSREKFSPIKICPYAMRSFPKLLSAIFFLIRYCYRRLK